MAETGCISCTDNDQAGYSWISYPTQTVLYAAGDVVVNNKQPEPKESELCLATKHLWN